jgi:hypothetical protein
MADMQRMRTSCAVNIKQPIINKASKDMASLLVFLDGCSQQSRTITEVVYCANTWDLGGVVNLQHHGVVLTIPATGFLALDFGRYGLTWMLCDVFPGCPEGTFLVRCFQIQTDAAVIRDYCADTKQFKWVGNNCKAWSKGLLKTLDIDFTSGRDMLVYEDEEDGSFIEPEEDPIVSRKDFKMPVSRLVKCA